MANDIVKLSLTAEETLKKKNTEYDFGYLNLGICSLKAAAFLNFVLERRKAICKNKVGRYYSSNREVRGGGLFIAGQGAITVNDLNEVGIKFNNTYRVYASLRTGVSGQSRIETVKDKLGNEVKKMWKVFSISDKVILKIEDYAAINSTEYLKFDQDMIIKDSSGKNCIQISFDEYRCIYEYLKGRKKEKTIEKYGAENYNTMIGNKISDPVSLQIIEQTKKMIQDTINEADRKIKEFMTEYDTKFQELRRHRDIMIAEVNSNKEKAIKEANAQMDELLKMANIVTMA